MADKKKASPDSVKAVQKLLKEQGFYKGDISGIKTWGTEAAIRAYQVQNKLKNTGEIDDVPTVAMSKSTPAPQAGGSAQPQAAAPAPAPQLALAPAPIDGVDNTIRFTVLSVKFDIISVLLLAMLYIIT